MLKLTKNCQKIILFLGNYPQEKFFSKEIAKKLNISLGGAHNALKYLIKKNITHIEQKGNMKFYQINDEDPLVKQIKSTAIIEQILPLINKIKSDCQKIILFGSASRGEQTADSDVDLLILSYKPKLIRNKINKFKSEMTIKAIIKTPNQWGETEINEPEFYNEVRQGIKLL